MNQAREEKSLRPELQPPPPPSQLIPATMVKIDSQPEEPGSKTRKIQETQIKTLPRTGSSKNPKAAEHGILPLLWGQGTEGKAGKDKVSSEDFLKICSTKHLKQRWNDT